MSVNVITSWNDEDFEEFSEMFYNNFSPDDWDYLIIGDSKNEVEHLAYTLHVCSYDMKEISGIANWSDAKWVAVTYHS